ncbi:transcriptional regulator, TetR family [Bacteriovorax sp. BSW11_IV]|uniref:TetR/AcrR family transcriptional regulator n=1 Tax=Bacteriovorax sp. BSW11_IV TaxID=1353529 RepID=UPI000389E5E2|nr:TetR/AcrR family transcriptional regulator [Bacteriovorax sp. BSW11_IV]EQC48608.1 transcriptional regulator, TetR family [Bacteriovorax sp. BSW11_IV]
MRKKTNTYHHGSLKESILHNASELVAQNGALDFSIRDISNKCEVSPAAIYKHFKSRNEIAVHMALDGAKILCEEFEKIAKSKGATLMNFAKAYIAFAKKHEGYFRAMYFKQIAAMEEYKEFETITEQLNKYLYESLKGSSNINELEHTIKRMLSCAHGISFLIIDQCFKLSDKEIDKILKDNLKDIK